MFQFFLDCDFVKGTDEKFPFNHFLNESWTDNKNGNGWGCNFYITLIN